eukprot:TRINITY_DN7651_c0_g1_i2.p1 TRINITY_DN7651_c0_g1~~TRINITY_DN7651_c0_g1_i2.p1  ORF type:complete len:878 (-),score=259.44 TRINITY_DN7651_c0_g1_i2:6-2639(-)
MMELQDSNKEKESAEEVKPVFKEPRKKLKNTFRVSSSIRTLFTGGKVAITSSEDQLLCACYDKISVVDIAAGKIARSLEADNQPITAFALSPDNQTLIACTSVQYFNSINFETGKAKRRWKGHDGPISCMAFDSTSTLVASGSADRSIKVWDAEGGFCTHNFRGHAGIITIVQFHTFKKKLHLFSAAEDGSIHAWDLNTHSSIFTLTDHMSAVTGLFLLSDSEMVSVGRDKVAIVWDLSAAKPKSKKVIPIYESIESAEILHSIPATSQKKTTKGNKKQKSTYLLTGGDKCFLRLWDIATGECVFEETTNFQKYPITQLQSFASGSRLISVTADQNIRFVDAATLKKEKLIVGFNDEIIDIKYLDENGPRVAVATNSEEIRVYDTKTNASDVLAGHTALVLCLDSNANASLLASGSKDHAARVWTTSGDSFRCMAVCTGHTEPVTAVAFGRKSAAVLFTASNDMTIKCWNIEDAISGESEETKEITAAVFSQKAHEKDINTLAVSPNDKLLASGSQDRTIKLWNTQNMKLIGTLSGHRRGVWCVEFSPVEQVLASSSGDTTIRLWSISDLTCLKTFEGHTNTVLRVSFINSGMQLISSGSDGLLKLWTIKTNECVNTFDDHTDKVWALAVRKDENEIISGGPDSVINIWEDCTAAILEEQLQASENRILQEQELANCIYSKNYKRAIELAFELGQPFKLLTIFEQVVAGRSEVIDEVIRGFTPKQLEKCLEYVSRWNTNAKHSLVSHKVLQGIFKNFSPTTLEQLPRIKELLEGILPYTERHFQRVDRLLQRSFIIDYTLRRMSPLLLGIKEEEKEEVEDVENPDAEETPKPANGKKNPKKKENGTVKKTKTNGSAASKRSRTVDVTEHRTEKRRKA